MSNDNKEAQASKVGWIAAITAIAALLAALGVNQFFPKLLEQWLATPSSELRYDGFYKEQNVADDSINYLRFYADGQVINGSSNTTANAGEVIQWFNAKNNLLGKGTYVKTPNGQIEFVSKSMMGEVAYTGRVKGDTLILDVKSRINQNESNKVYQFMAAPSAN